MCVEWSFVAAYKVCSGVLVVVLGFFFFSIRLPDSSGAALAKASVIL